MQLIKLDTVKKYGAIITKNIPYKLQIFFAALYIWTCIFYYISKAINIVLENFLTYAPAILFPNYNKTPVQILRAIDDRGNEITEHLKMFMNYKWDKSLCDEKGGVDLDIFAKCVDTTCIWMSYILEMDVDDIFDKIGHNGNENDFKKNIRIAIINFGEKIILKLKGDSLEGEDILFGEIDLF